MKKTETVTEKAINREVDKFFDGYPTPTIDNPPKDKEPKQTKLLPDPEPEEQAEGYTPKYDVAVALRIKSGTGQPYSVPLMAGEYPCDRIEECLALALKSKRFTNVLRAITGQGAEADAKPEPKKKETPPAKEKKEKPTKTKKESK
jgi:hypothetical protein